jgi:hypothetical protein
MLTHADVWVLGEKGSRSNIKADLPVFLYGPGQ